MGVYKTVSGKKLEERIRRDFEKSGLPESKFEGFKRGWMTVHDRFMEKRRGN